MTKQATRRLAPAIASAFSIARGVSIMHQIDELVRRAVGRQHGLRLAHGLDVLGLRQRIASAPAVGDRHEIGIAPGRVQPVDPDHDLALAVAAGLDRVHHLGARLALGLGRHRILEVEDQHVGRQALRLLERALVGARHIEALRRGRVERNMGWPRIRGLSADRGEYHGSARQGNRRISGAQAA